MAVKDKFIRDLQIQLQLRYDPLKYCYVCKWTTCVKAHNFCPYGCGLRLTLWEDRWLFGEIDFSLEEDWL